jgi:hypothetical protein
MEAPKLQIFQEGTIKKSICVTYGEKIKETQRHIDEKSKGNHENQRTHKQITENRRKSKESKKIKGNQRKSVKIKENNIKSKEIDGNSRQRQTIKEK